MSVDTLTALIGISRELENLVRRVVGGIVAVRTAPHSVASGICIDTELVAVCDHRLKRTDRVSLVLSDGGELTASVVGRAPDVDIAILRAEGAVFSPLPQAEPSGLKAGALSVVIGLTSDVGPSTSLGILGAVGGQRRTWRGGTLDQFIRLDVNLYPSQSGAAVVNMEGELVGLASPALSRHSTIAVPVATIQRISAELLKEGRIRRGYLGVGMQPVALPASLRTKTGATGESGLMLLSVEPNSPAEQAGLQLGDILISLDGKAISDVEELQDSLHGEAVGSTRVATVIRGGEVFRAPVRIAERPSSRKIINEEK